MKLKEYLLKLRACQEAIEWAGDMYIEEVVKKCHRGDWLLWLAQMVDMDIRTLTLAKARSAKTVIHLMEDQRSIDAINVAERFGLGEVGEDELKDAADAAAFAARAAEKQNQKQTADICRQTFGELLIELVKKQIS